MNDDMFWWILWGSVTAVIVTVVDIVFELGWFYGL